MESHLSRRTALLAIGGTIGIAAVPIAAVSKIEHDSAGSWEWDQAVANYRDAAAATSDYQRDYLDPLSDAYLKVRDRWPLHYNIRSDPHAAAAIEEVSKLYDPVQARFDDLVSEQGDACQHMLLIPAPHVEALAVKLETFVTEEVWEWTDNKAVFQAVCSDARRLAAREA